MLCNWLVDAGPFAARLPDALTPVLDSYVSTIEPSADATNEAYLFHPATGSAYRPMESSAWTQYVRRLFGRLTGTEIAPKVLRTPHATPNLYIG